MPGESGSRRARAVVCTARLCYSGVLGLLDRGVVADGSQGERQGLQEPVPSSERWGREYFLLWQRGGEGQRARERGFALCMGYYLHLIHILSKHAEVYLTFT